MQSDVCPKAGAVFQYFFSPKPKQNVKSNGFEDGYFLPKRKTTFLRESMTTYPKSSKKELYYNGSEEFSFWIIEVIEAAAFKSIHMALDSSSDRKTKYNI